MRTRRHALVGAAAVAGAVLGLTTQGSSFAVSEAALDGTEVTASSCQAVGGDYSVVKDKKTCTVVTTMTFTGVEDQKLGRFEPVTDPDVLPMVWRTLAGQWQSAQVVSTSTTWSQRDLGPVTERTAQSVLSYSDFEYAVCEAVGFNAAGDKLGGGQMESNTPCKERGLLPATAPDEPLAQPWE